MYRKVFIILFFLILACSKKEEVIYSESKRVDAFKIYNEALEAFNKKDYFFASKKFDQAEINFTDPVLAAKASIMSSYSLYGINFYNQAEENLKRFFSVYPADKNLIYAKYLLSIIYYEQIQDEKKDLAPLIKARDQINIFLKNYPDSDYATDLKFKMNLIQNQLAAKELFIAKYYVSIKKWVPAINRLRNIVENYDKTIFIEEALHRLVEIHFYLGLEQESKKYASLLGYNYNSSEWYEQSYKVLNKNYNVEKIKPISEKEEESLFKKIIELVK